MIYDTFLYSLKEYFKDNKIITKELNKIDDNLVSTYVDIMNDFNTELLYKSKIHGLDHNIRASLFALLISSGESVSVEDFSIALEACKYHDTGRTNDFEDDYHGARSSKKVDFLKSKYSKSDMAYMKAIITAHSISDKDRDKMISKYKLDNKERYYRLLNILKDSDGLDRVRTNDLDPKYLRTKRAHELVDFSYELFKNYNDFLTTLKD